MITLRPYQQESLDQLRRLMGNGVRRILLVSPTGSGKGSTIAYMIHGSAAKGKRVLFLVAGRQLVAEFSERLEHQLGVEHGVVMAGHKKRNLSWPVQVASIDTLASMVRAGRQLPPADLIIADEADQGIAPRFLVVLGMYPKAYVVGTTATPIRADGKGMGEYFDALHVAATPRGLIGQGFLSDLDGLAFQPDLDESELKEASRSDNAAERVFEGLSASRKEKRCGHLVEEWHRAVGEGSLMADGTRRSRPAPTVGFALHRADSREVVARFNAERHHGAPICQAVHIDGDTTLAERAEVHRLVREGEIHVVANVGVMGRGVDWPVLEVVALWRPTGSLALYMQQCGRAFRLYPGKQRAFILDHVGAFERFGAPDDDRDWSLEGDGGSGKAKDKVVSLRRCGKCGAEFLSRREECPRCHEPVHVEEQEPTVERTTGVVAVGMREVAVKAAPDRGRLARHLWTLRQLGRQNGRGDGWALATWRKQHRDVPMSLLNEVSGR